jgi:hypothetical protein
MIKPMIKPGATKPGASLCKNREYRARDACARWCPRAARVGAKVSPGPPTGARFSEEATEKPGRSGTCNLACEAWNPTAGTPSEAERHSVDPPSPGHGARDRGVGQGRGTGVQSKKKEYGTRAGAENDVILRVQPDDREGG